VTESRRSSILAIETSSSNAVEYVFATNSVPIGAPSAP
jgi:hypothetical protein